MKKRVTGDEALKMMNRGTKEVVREYTGEDAWWGKGYNVVTYYTVDGVKYRAETDRDGWTDLVEVAEA